MRLNRLVYVFLNVGLISLLVAFGKQSHYRSWTWANEGNNQHQAYSVSTSEGVLISSGNRLSLIYPKTGKLKWKYPSGAPLNTNFRWNPVVKSGKVFLADKENRLHAVNLSDGKKLWQHKSEIGFFGPPAATEAFVVIPTRESSLLTLKADSGQEAWRTPHRIFEGIAGRLVAHRSNIYGFTRKGDLFSFNVVCREFNWCHKIRSPRLANNSKPIVYGGKVYITDGYLLQSLCLKTGKVEWEKALRYPPTSNPSVSYHGVGIVTKAGRLVSFDLAGNPKNKNGFKIGAADNVNVAWAHENLVTFDLRNVVQLVSPKDNKLLWSYHFSGTALPQRRSNFQRGRGRGASPVDKILFASDMLYVWQKGEGLSAFNRKMGVDKTPPHVVMEDPVWSGRIPTQKNSAIKFRVSDDSSGVDPNSIQVYIDGYQVRYNYYLDGRLIVAFGNKSGNRIQTNGRKVVKVEVSDWAGNKASRAFIIEVDNSL